MSKQQDDRIYVVVLNPGTDREVHDASFRTISEAIKFAKRNWQPDHYDVMKRLPDGNLTTEF